MRKCILFNLVFIFTSGLLSCTAPEEKLSVGRAFYHWKTIFDLQPAEKEYLEKLKVNKLYLHFFDVDLEPVTFRSTPKATIVLKTPPDREIIPTVFITNKTLELSPQNEIEPLAKNIVLKINAIASANHIRYHEIQIDCDWSKSTRKKYFRLLSRIKEGLPADKKLSVTIRLHQVKFPDITGVPPADRGTLMIYNTGDWKNIYTKNSLFDLNTIGQYLDNLPDYPLDLDIALPVFEQTLVYRNSVFLHFIKEQTSENLNALDFLKKTTNPAIFVCTKDTVYTDVAFRKGDVFRHERASFEDILEIKKNVTTKLRNKNLSIIIYHLDEKSVKNYSLNQLEELFAEN